MIKATFDCLRSAVGAVKSCRRRSHIGAFSPRPPAYKDFPNTLIIYQNRIPLIMKLFSFIAVVSLFATATLAQNVVIGRPANNTQVSPGQSLTIEIDKPVSDIFYWDAFTRILCRNHLPLFL
jgi:hypothetical protein